MTLENDFSRIKQAIFHTFEEIYFDYDLLTDSVSASMNMLSLFNYVVFILHLKQHSIFFESDGTKSFYENRNLCHKYFKHLVNFPTIKESQ